ncbi:MAG: trypsin-like peptidase domain-containing protein [Sandaracinus sp.]|nr:trypsin-like peptidase domain-containing protein [Sandaracinus sp.]
MRNTALLYPFAIVLLSSCATELVSSAESASICGPTVDWQGVMTYDGSLGPTVDFVDHRERAVGQVFPIGCTGTLISENLFLTAGHCIRRNTVRDDAVRFNYQNDALGVPQTVDTYAIEEVVEVDNGGFDYAILRLEGSPGDTWGFTPVSGFAARAGSAVTLIQHPAGNPKVVDGGTLAYDPTGRITYGDLDTLGGSSGSGVLQDATGFVVGVHIQRGCTSSGGANVAEPMLDLLDVSPTLRDVAFDASEVMAIL